MITKIKQFIKDHNPWFQLRRALVGLTNADRIIFEQHQEIEGLKYEIEERVNDLMDLRKQYDRLKAVEKLHLKELQLKTHEDRIENLVCDYFAAVYLYAKGYYDQKTMQFITDKPGAPFATALAFGIEERNKDAGRMLVSILKKRVVNCDAAELAAKLIEIHTHAEIAAEQDESQIVYRQADLIQLFSEMGVPQPDFEAGAELITEKADQQ